MKEYEIRRLGRLSLAYKTFIGREATNDEIEITMWNEKFTNRWTIASFEKDNEGYYLKSCGESLNNEEINWFEFGILVTYGFDYLNDELELIDEKIEEFKMPTLESMKDFGEKAGKAYRELFEGFNKGWNANIEEEKDIEEINIWYEFDGKNNDEIIYQMCTELKDKINELVKAVKELKNK